MRHFVEYRYRRTVCGLQGHNIDRHWNNLFRDSIMDEEPWCARCGSEEKDLKEMQIRDRLLLAIMQSPVRLGKKNP